MILQRLLIVFAVLCVLYAPSAKADGTVPQLTIQQFADTVKSAEHPVLIEFKARWCPYCKKVQPDIEGLRASHLNSLDVYQVDVDDDPDIAADYNAHILPTLIILWHGEEVGRNEGALYGDDLASWVKDVEGDIHSKKPIESDSTQAL